MYLSDIFFLSSYSKHKIPYSHKMLDCHMEVHGTMFLGFLWVPLLYCIFCILHILLPTAGSIPALIENSIVLQGRGLEDDALPFSGCFTLLSFHK